MPTSRRLILLCHAPTAATRAAAFPGDEGLEADGVAQAEALRGRLPAAAGVLSSPARAAVETARALARRVDIAASLADCDFGRWRGRTLAKILASEPEAAQSWLSEPTAAPHGGESIAQLAARTGAWLDGLGAGGTLVCVTHQAVIRAALLHVLAAPLDRFWRVDIQPLGIVELSWTTSRWHWRAAAL